MSQELVAWGPDGPSEKQLALTSLLAGPQRHTLAVGGSRSRKTFTFMRAMATRALRAPESRHLAVRFRANAAKSSLALDTLPKVMRLCFPNTPYELRGDGYFEFPNESQIWYGGLDDKERVEKILGNEYVTILFNECSQIPYASVVTARTRLAQNVAGLKQRAYYDLNPVGKGHWTALQFIHLLDPVTKQPLREPDNYKHMFINPRDNPTLDPDYLRELEDLPERQRRRFLLGEYVEEVDGALWTYEIIERHRREEKDVPDMRRRVIVVDPSGAASESDFQADEIGIAVCGLGVDGHGYVEKDLSLRAAPAVWGRAAIKAYHDYHADCIVAEQNFGGEMVRYVIQSQDANVPVRVVTASRGKVIRAEPVSALYEKGLVHHVGRLPALEDQLCAFSTIGYMGSASPDRADAAIWGITVLLLPESPGIAHVIEHYKREAQEKPKSLVPTGTPKEGEPMTTMQAIAAASDGNIKNTTIDLTGKIVPITPPQPLPLQTKQFTSFTEAQAEMESRL